MLKFAKFFLALSAAAVIASIVLLVTPGLKLSIDFTGGTLMEVALPEEVTKIDVQGSLEAFKEKTDLGNVAISTTTSKTLIMRMRNLSNEEHLSLLSHLESTLGITEEQQFTTIGPTVGSSLKSRAIWALSLALIAIIFYVAFAFRKVPRRLSPWRFGVIAVLTLIHDILITVGIFILISQHTAFEFDTLFVTALLTILGYSVNDTIVIFDRVRENLSLKGKNVEFPLLANQSLLQSIPRSINTSVSTLIMLSMLFVLGSDSIRWFVLALIIGTVIGTYSSIFLATPLLVYWKKK